MTRPVILAALGHIQDALAASPLSTGRQDHARMALAAVQHIATPHVLAARECIAAGLLMPAELLLETAAEHAARMERAHSA